MRAVTDQGPTEMNQTKPEVIENLFTLMRVVSAPDVVAHFDELYNKCEIRYGDMKKQLAADILKVTAPIRDRYNEIVRDEDYLRRVAAQGAERARQSSDATLQEVRKIMGIRRF
jgi:tryptophanyl-tRNA synthetase